jgi:hypothetical protein
MTIGFRLGEGYLITSVGLVLMKGKGIGEKLIQKR